MKGHYATSNYWGRLFLARNSVSRGRIAIDRDNVAHNSAEMFGKRFTITLRRPRQRYLRQIHEYLSKLVKSCFYMLLCQNARFLEKFSSLVIFAKFSEIQQNPC